MRTCPYCEKEIDPNSSICPYCGLTIAYDYLCPECGKVFTTTGNFRICPLCKADLLKQLN